MNSLGQIEVNLNTLDKNLKKLINYFNEYEYKFVDLRNKAFGLGFFCVKKIVENNINYIYVSTLKEALEVRKYNQNINILVEKEIDLEYIFDAINHNITISIYNNEYFKKLVSLNIKDNLKIHLVVDNLVNHLGIKTLKEINEIIYLSKELKNINIEGIYSNITNYGYNDDFYYEQVENFYSIIKDINENLIIHLNEPIMYHGKIKKVNGIKFDLALFGLTEQFSNSYLNNWKHKSLGKNFKTSSWRNLELSLDLVFEITSEVIAFKEIEKGTKVGKNYVCKEDGILVIVDIGHKDGITKAIKEVVINDNIWEVIADDLDYLYVFGQYDVEVKDKVYLISDYNYIDNVLQNLRTNRYYLMSIINSNLKRIYLEGEEVEEVE